MQNLRPDGEGSTRDHAAAATLGSLSRVAGGPSRGQIRADRYYAVHLLGELKEPNAVPILLTLLNDQEVNYKVAWALGEIGGDAAVLGLVQALRDRSPDVRVIAIQAIEKLYARETLPHLRPLLNDHHRSHIGDPISVAEAAQSATAKLERSRK